MSLFLCGLCGEWYDLTCPCWDGEDDWDDPAASDYWCDMFECPTRTQRHRDR